MKIDEEQDNFIMMISFECQDSREALYKLNNAADTFADIQDLKFYFVDMTLQYSAGNWIYWTPLTRFYP